MIIERLNQLIGGGRRKIALIAAVGLLSIIALDLAFPPPIHRAADVSPLVLDREGRWVHAFTTSEGRWRFAANIDEIDPAFLERVVLIEDKRFWRHPGVDPLAIVRAARSSVSAGAIVSGASTVTMQTARLLEPRPRTLPSKAIEMIRALQIERRLDKREILELYLTLAPYGGNIEGVRAASLLYFGKEPTHLSDAEQALLIALPQSPESRRPDLRPRTAKTARKEILVKLLGEGAIGEHRVTEASEAFLPQTKHAFPRAAYHLAASLAKTATADERRTAIEASLDLKMQIAAEAIAERYAAAASDEATVSILIIDNKSREVRAHVGSSGVDAAGGWIDLTAANRSPGSLLKPFIYGLAFEDGAADPDTIIDDMPRAFGGYSPENFDRTFRGEVRIREALQHSLNLPAVTALNAFGAQRFAATLTAAGVGLKSRKRADKKEGLALALGGAGVTAQDIGALYAGLANEGEVRSLTWRASENNEGNGAENETQTYHLISAANAARINDILRGAPSLSGRAPALLSETAPRIAYKTGTSYGYRDAWAAGHAGAYTVVVWVGRADGAPRPGMTGRKAAAPLLFDLFDQLALIDPDQPRLTRPPEESNLQTRKRFELSASVRAPEIVFPRDGAELFADRFDARGRGFSLAARGGAGGYQWYIAGAPVPQNESNGRFTWRPEKPGFYEAIVVDDAGRQSKAKFRVSAG